jgi:hypothetical protein
VPVFWLPAIFQLQAYPQKIRVQERIQWAYLVPFDKGIGFVCFG